MKSDEKSSESIENRNEDAETPDNFKSNNSTEEYELAITTSKL